MSSRSDQMHRLAYTLDRRYNVRVTATYDRPDGWRLEWVDGPLEDEVRAAITRLAPHLDAITTLRLHRGYTDLSEAVSLLLWIDEDPARLYDEIRSWHLQEARGECRYPMSAPDRWLARGRALLKVGPLATAGVDALRRWDGWTDAVWFLDQLAARQPISA
ncbi:hypothetical protein [Nocardia thailandica]|uniref:hypothetical protein n=1 Tax=Nocardia thailandica TaxID=257275 RepID=UPI0002D6DA70|nr:hypothetical protein [Nocardia thailandica]